MKKFTLAIALSAISFPAFAQVGRININQQVGPSTGQLTTRAVVPAANQILGFDANKKLVAIDPATALTNSNAAVLQHASVTLTAAQLRALNTTPVSVLAAQGTGKTAVLVGPVLLRYTQATANLGGGGAIVVQYHTGTVAATGTLAAARLTGASTENVIVPVAAAAVANDIIEITCATGDFTGGTAAGTLLVDFDYRVI